MAQSLTGSSTLSVMRVGSACQGIGNSCATKGARSFENAARRGITLAPHSGAPSASRLKAPTPNIGSSRCSLLGSSRSSIARPAPSVFRVSHSSVGDHCVSLASAGECKAAGTFFSSPAVRTKGQSSRKAAQLRASAHPSAQPYGVPEDVAEPDRWDVVGLGQAMVDFSAMVSDNFLDSLSLPRGQRVVVDHQERGEVLQALDGCAYKLSAGGSLSNTLVALARLGSGSKVVLTPGKEQVVGGGQALSGHCEAGTAEVAQGRGKVNVAMVGSVGSDALGDFYRTKLRRANVHFLSPPIQGGTTGTVIVLTTPDAQRTMLSYQGMSSEVAWDTAMESVVAKSRVLVVEGYLWELPQTVDAIEEACAAARSKGLLVALTASDATCVLRHRPKFWSVLCRSAHVLFTNVSEARALTGCSESTSAAALAQHLSQFCPLVAVTDGERGSYLGLRGQVTHIPAQQCVARDTCGAGDAYAAGVLYALLKGAPDLESIGSIASRVSSVVVSQQGARLGEEDAVALGDSLGFPDRGLSEGQVFHSMMGLASVEEASALPINAMP